MESYYPPCPFRSRNVKREEFFPQSKFIKLAIISYPRTNYDRSDPRTDYRNVCPFRKQQQQQQRGRLPFLWIFLLSLLSSLLPSLSLFNLFLPLLLPSRWKGPRRISEGLVESRKLCWLAHTKSKEASQVIARPTGR